MKHIKSSLELIDIFNINFNLYFEGKKNFSTLIGGIMTIITMGLAVVAFFYFSIDLFDRKNPVVNVVHEFSTIAKKINNTLPIAVAIKSYGQVTRNEEFFYEIREI